MGCGVYWTQIRELERAMGSMRTFGILESDASYLKLNALRGKLIKQVGFKFPRTVTQIIKLIGLSPGTVTLWHDIESGWMSEARVRPDAPPVYKAVSDEVAMAILKREVTPELESILLEPVEYYGE